MFHNLFDSHIHSDNSWDAAHSVMYLCEKAEERGLMGLAITDHADSVYCKEPGYLGRIVQSMVDVAKAKIAFRHRLAFSAGIEIGIHHDVSVAQQICEMYPFDFVLGSVHNRPDGSEYYDVRYSALSPQERHDLLAEYFASMRQLVDWGGFDSLAHMTFPLRSAMRDRGIRLDLAPHKEQIEVILKGLARKGKALELNTSALRSPLKDTMPPLWILKWFRELGGEYVTIGSDAHGVEHVGAGIQQGMELLSEAGFDFFAFYKERRPVMLRIV